ncbi:MAG: YheT family hydrolase [Balneolaceae bacterium]
MRDLITEKVQICTGFSPPLWCRGGHRQTIFSSLFKASVDIGAERLRINTPDQDFLDIDFKENKNSKRAAILFHGLEGSSRRYYITHLAKVLFLNGYSTIAVNFRSCSGDMNRKPRFYHSGETDDLETVIKWANESFPTHKLFAAGFSLGASTLFNFLRRHRTAHPIQAIAAISTPFDLKKDSLNLNNGLNRIYNYYFLKSLRKKIELKRKKFPDLPEFTGSTLYEFDDQITAPLHGFKDADHYYESCSSAFFIDCIQSPVMIIHSRQDPLSPYHFCPVSDIIQNSNITNCFVENGGHVGFWSRQSNWLENSVLSYFNEF